MPFPNLKLLDKSYLAMKIIITSPGVALLQICRQHGELPKWNTLHLSEADALRAIQLCIGERMKQVKMG